MEKEGTGKGDDKIAPDQAGEEDKARLKEAKKHFTLGVFYYNEGDYDLAIEEFTKSFS